VYPVFALKVEKHSADIYSVGFMAKQPGEEKEWNGEL